MFCDPCLSSFCFASGQHRVLGRLHQPIQQLRAQLPVCHWWRGSRLLLRLLRICLQQHQGPPTTQSDTQPPHQWLTGDDQTKSNESPTVLSPGHLSGNIPPWTWVWTNQLNLIRLDQCSHKKGLNMGNDHQGQISRHFCIIFIQFLTLLVKRAFFYLFYISSCIFMRARLHAQGHSPAL